MTPRSSSVSLGVVLGPAVEPQPRHDPQQPEQSGDDEDSAPVEACREEGDQDGGDGGPEGRPGGIDADHHASFTGREPLGDSLGRGGVVAGLADAEQEAVHAERDRAAAERGQHAGDGPPDDEAGHRYARAEPIGEAASEEVGDG